ncbi:hypothetical protein [Achromobacter spanius]|uniref:Transposase n=1 Tax=Achromobacter spanius TaxID=217203 RepID=A0A2S0I1H6_9BURK|nr:hypothetical protein [Achromobacter spanius]AVJ25876.1 hypothetical protein CLM73_01375 [Achromobacter spanius]
MDTPDSRSGPTPPFDGLRAYLRAVQSRDDLQRIRQLEQRNGRLKRSVERLMAARDPAAQCPKSGFKALKRSEACALAELISRVKRLLA